MTDEDRAAIIARLAAPTPAAPSFVRPLAVCLLGLVGVLSSFILITRDDELAALGALALIGGIVAVVGGGLRFLGASSRHEAHAESLRARASLEAARQQGDADVVEIVADAAWDAPELDDDAMAVLLRVGRDRFVHINTHRLHDLFPDDKWDRVPGRIVLRFARNDNTLLDAKGHGQLLDIRTDLPEREWGHYQEALGEHVDWTSDFTELDENQLPEDWIPIVRQP